MLFRTYPITSPLEFLIESLIVPLLPSNNEACFPTAGSASRVTVYDGCGVEEPPPPQPHPSLIFWSAILFTFILFYKFPIIC